MANGNCKKVRCITTGKLYGSVNDAANANGVSGASMSYALKHKSKSKGNVFVFAHEEYRYIPKMAERISEVTEENAQLKAKAEAWDKYVAEKEAEERRIAKAKELHDAAVVKAEAKVAKLEAKYERKADALDKAKVEARKAFVDLEKAIEELNALNADMTVEWEVN